MLLKPCGPSLKNTRLKAWREWSSFRCCSHCSRFSLTFMFIYLYIIPMSQHIISVTVLWFSKKKVSFWALSGVRCVLSVIYPNIITVLTHCPSALSHWQRLSVRQESVSMSSLSSPSERQISSIASSDREDEGSGSHEFLVQCVGWCNSREERTIKRQIQFSKVRFKPKLRVGVRVCVFPHLHSR